MKAYCSRFLSCLSLFFCPSVSHHVPCFFHLMRVAGQRECPALSVCVWVCAFHCLWGHEICPNPQGTLGTALPRHIAFLSALHTLLQPFLHLHPVWWCVCRHYGCMHVLFLSTCSSSLCSHGDLHPNQSRSHLSINHLVPLCC